MVWNAGDMMPQFSLTVFALLCKKKLNVFGNRWGRSSETAKKLKNEKRMLLFHMYGLHIVDIEKYSHTLIIQTSGEQAKKNIQISVVEGVGNWALQIDEVGL